MTTPEGDNPNPEVPEQPTPTPTEDPKPAATPEKTFSQGQVNRLNTEARKRGEEEARKALAEQWGVSLEEAEKRIKASIEQEEASKSELQRLNETLETTKRDTESTVSTLKQDNHRLNVKLQLAQSGLALPEDKAERAEALDRVIGLVTAPVGATDEEIVENINKLREQLPSLFTTQPATPAGNVPSNPRGTPAKPSLEGVNLAERGAQRAAEFNAKHGVATPTA